MPLSIRSIPSNMLADLTFEPFYVYLHARPTGDIFYIGKGSGFRAFDFSRNRNKHHRNIVGIYGQSNIIVSVWPCGTEEQAFEIEKIAIDVFRLNGARLCNLTDGGDGIAGYKHTQETKKLLSAIHSGRTLPQSQKDKMSASRKGHICSQITREKISAQLLGRIKPEFSKEWKNNMAEALRGRIVTEETRLKISKSLTGKKLSPDHRKKLSEVHTGKKWTQTRRNAYERRANGK